MNFEELREDFEVLKKGIVYFDSACMSLKPRQVVDKINEYYNEYPGCGGRSAHQFTKRVDEEVNNTRKLISKMINCKPEEVIFTKNTTESINLVANCFLNSNDKVVISDREHNSNLIPWIKRKNQIVVRGNKDHTFNLENFKKALDKNVKLVSIVYTSNLDGYSLPIKEIIKISHANGSYVLLDGAQAIPHKEINIKKLDADFLAFSGHKMLGPTGTGVLFGKRNLLEKMDTFMLGGETVYNSTYDSYNLEKVPTRFEAGLQNYAGIIGLGEATKYLMKINNKIEEHENKLNKILSEGIVRHGGEIVGVKDYKLRGGIVSFKIRDLDVHNTAKIFDKHGILLRSGNHCVHSWFNANNIKGSVRASLYFYNTEQECERFLEVFKNISKNL